MGCGTSTPVNVVFGEPTTAAATTGNTKAGKPMTATTTTTASEKNKAPTASAAAAAARNRRISANSKPQTTIAGGGAAASPSANNKVSQVSSTNKPSQQPANKASQQPANNASQPANRPSPRRKIKKKTNSSTGGGAASAPSTRTRADTWETNLTDEVAQESQQQHHHHQQITASSAGSKTATSPSTAAAAPQQQVDPKTTIAVQEQWQRLWETQSAALVDPADVVSVLDQLIGTTINKLSPVQITLLQRKVRFAVKQLPRRAEQAGSKIAKVFSGAASDTAVADTEARNAVEKYHLLTAAVLQRVLPATPVTDSIVQLMLSFGGPDLTERVLTAAKAAAAHAGLEMMLDVNKKQQQQQQERLPVNGTAKNSNSSIGWNMPKPSQVPELDEPVEDWPVGASFAVFCAVIAMATASSVSSHTTTSSGSMSRSQRLQLLFYTLMDSGTLQEFLATHPAGGMPLWLLEVGNSTVISLPSLTHYHYYGNAFLPCGTATTTGDDSSAAAAKQKKNYGGVPSFVASKSRVPVTVGADRVLRIVEEALRRAAVAHKAVNGRSNNHRKHQQVHDGGYPFDEGRPVASMATRLKDSVSMIGPASLPVVTLGSLISKSSSTNDLQNMADSSDHAERSIFPKTTLMLKLQGVADGVDLDTYSPVGTELDQSMEQFETATAAFLDHLDVPDWTLQEFRQWADAALDDLALDVVMHRLFSEGILPSPALERELVLKKWLEWQAQQDRSRKPIDGASVSERLTNSVSALIGSWNRNGDRSGDVARLGAVWGGIGGIDGLGGTGYGVMYCIPAVWWDAWTVYTGWSFVGERPKRRKRRTRPASLQTESLLEKDPDYISRGIMGSYEVMRRGLKQGRDYVVVPPGVWDILFELYSGGPPLPRMVKSLERKLSASILDDPPASDDSKPFLAANSSDELDEVIGDLDGSMRVMRIPDRLSVETHPWILHVHLCDPLQPYRRGDTGPVSIRVMVCPSQPLWRLFSELVCRFSFQSYKAFDADCRGMARLWKKMEPNGAKDAPIPRYGPWILLCKSRHAVLPQITNGLELEESYNDVIAD